MIYGVDWTADRVTHQLTEILKRLPGIGIYSPRPHVLISVALLRPIDGSDLITATADYLGQSSPERVALLSYCWAMTRHNGQNVKNLCRDRGWSRATLYRRVGKAAEIVADGLRRDRKIVLDRETLPDTLYLER